MPFQRPALSVLQQQAESDITSRIDGGVPALRRSIFGALSKGLAGLAHGLYSYLQSRSVQSVPYTATGSDLEGWATLFGVTRGAASVASGLVRFAGDPGRTIAAGSTLTSADGFEYSIDAPLLISGSGTVDGSVTCLTPGAAGNLASSNILSFISAPIGINASAVVQAPGLAGGMDAGDDEALRAALLQRIQNAPHGGSAADYIFWAKQVINISRAWVFPLYSGAGTVRVFVANDAYSGANLATAGDVLAAQSYIDSVKPVTVAVSDGLGGWTSGVTVAAPIKTPVAITLSVSPDNAEVRAAITANLTALFRDEAAPEGSVPLNHIRVAIGTATGEFDHNLTAPVATPTAAAGHILSLGTITWL